VILAGGEGVRLSSFTRQVFGYHIPKQFFPLFEGKTLLEQTMERVELLIPRSRMITVLNRAHEWFYSPLVDGTASGNLLVQPANRGTAPAILCALLRLIESRQRGTVAIFPSDHYVSDDSIFMRHVSAAIRSVDRSPELTVLLGITPDGPEPEYGWIEPAPPVAAGESAVGQICQIRRFWEKPSPDIARDLYNRGYLWNSFVLVASASNLLSLISKALPELYRTFTEIQSFLGTAIEEDTLEETYGSFPPIDFSSHVLARFPQELAVLPVTEVSWSDLGTPERLLAATRSAPLGFQKIRPDVRCPTAFDKQVAGSMVAKVGEAGRS
jgi:mannose-1-phosphate guanylyltransferase